MERVRDLIVDPFPLFFPLLLPFPVWPFYNMATLEALEPYHILLIRGESIVFMLLKEPVIHCSV
jgi:hypothetical protein